MVSLPHAVAEEGPAGEGTGGIDGDHADGLAPLPKVVGQCVGEGGLSPSGGPGNADPPGGSRGGEQDLEDLAALRAAVLDFRDGAGEGRPVLATDPLDLLMGCRIHER